MRKRNQEFERGTFNVPMNLQLFADGGAEGGDPADGGNANGSGGDQDPQGKQPSVDELLVQLSEERARNAQLQNEKNTASTEAANYKKQLRAKMSAEDQAAAAKAEADAQKDARIKELEAKISNFLGTDDTILYSSCFDANGGVFEPLFTEEDAIISDSLNHASIIDGVRLCKAKRYRYANADMAELEKCLQEAQAQRFRIIVTDGVFSMDGNVAPMDKICDLAEKYDALVMVDESHSAGVVGATGHGVSELYNTYGRVDIYTGTLGKAFGGALGGFTTGRKEIIDLLRQRSRPYLFSNSLAPGIIGASLEVFKMLKESNALHDKLVENVNYFRDKMTAAGFDIKPTQSAICAVMLYDAKLSQVYAARMQEEGIYVTGFYYPVVPKGQARIRVQISAGHNKEHLDKCIEAFIKVGKELGVLK